MEVSSFCFKFHFIIRSLIQKFPPLFCKGLGNSHEILFMDFLQLIIEEVSADLEWGNISYKTTAMGFMVFRTVDGQLVKFNLIEEINVDHLLST